MAKSSGKGRIGFIPVLPVLLGELTAKAETLGRPEAYVSALTSITTSCGAASRWPAGLTRM